MIALHRIPETPAITHAQVFVLELLLVFPLRCNVLRDELEEFGLLRTKADFYELFERLEELGFVAGYYTAKIVGEAIVRERSYEITNAGLRAYCAAYAFYSDGVLELLK